MRKGPNQASGICWECKGTDLVLNHDYVIDHNCFKQQWVEYVCNSCGATGSWRVEMNVNKMCYVNVFLVKDVGSSFSIEEVKLTKHATENVARSEFFEGFDKLGLFKIPLSRSAFVCSQLRDLLEVPGVQNI